MLQITAIRLPTCQEWDDFMGIEAVSERNEVAHWKGLYSWCHDEYPRHTLNRAVRGWVTARNWNYHSSSFRFSFTAFRPAFEFEDANATGEDGALFTVGTLYMDGQPVKVPQSPICGPYGDVSDYALGTKLEIRKALSDPVYQVQAIKSGSILMTDRNLLKTISWDDVQSACAWQPALDSA